jgi:hypothetical protein
MQTFISKPVERPIVPIISVRDLVDGVLQFVQTIIVFDYDRLKIEKYSEEKQTSITLYGRNITSVVSGFDIKQIVYLTIYDKAVDSIDSRLSQHPFDIRISIPEAKKWMEAKITPLANKSISIEIVKS